MNRVIIAGGRDIIDYNLVCKAIKESQFVIDEVVCGKARGVDSLGEKWAKENNISIRDFPAEWDIYGKSAGYVRNEQMGKYGTHLILVWDGKSRGSASMLKIAQRNKLIIFKKII